MSIEVDSKPAHGIKSRVDGRVPSQASLANPLWRDDGGDEALKAVGNRDTPLQIDPATNRRLVRKIDRTMLPVLCAVFFFNYLEKIALSYASVTGLQKDIHLRADNYQWLGSAFFFGFLGFEFIAIRLLQYFPLAKYTGFCVFACGVVSVCSAAVENFSGAAAIRVLLGAFEASVHPGFALFTSQWYRKDEQTVRVSWWLCMSGFAGIVGGPVAYGIAHGADTHGYSIAAWKIIYLCIGSSTIVLSIIFWLFVPDNQLNARWLSPQDRVLAVERVRVNQQGVGSRRFKAYQLKEALTDPITWALILLAICFDIPTAGLASFQNLLLESFNLTSEQSLLWGTISGVPTIVSILGWGYVTAYFGNRLLWGMTGMILALTGSIILVVLPTSNPGGRLAGFYLTQFFATPYVTGISLLATNVAGYTKKTTVSGAYFIAFCVGGIIGPLTFRPRDAPYYIPALSTFIACYGVVLADMLFIYWWCRKENAKKRKFRSNPSYSRLVNQEFLDLTDRENPDFEYSL